MEHVFAAGHGCKFVLSGWIVAMKAQPTFDRSSYTVLKGCEMLCMHRAASCRRCIEPWLLDDWLDLTPNDSVEVVSHYMRGKENNVSM